MSETMLVHMIGNNICYAVDHLQETASAAFSPTPTSFAPHPTPPHISEIIQQNNEGYPHSIIIAGMLFLNEEKNQSKAQMYVCSDPEFQGEYMLHELCWAGVDVDGMLKMAAEQNINQL